MPQQAPPLTNPPVPFDDEPLDRARAALGGTAAGAAGEGPAASPAADRPKVEDGKAPPSRFEPPQEMEFEFAPPERQEIRNNNVPLTIGLLASILAAFLVFFVSLAGGAAGEDPLMPSFWRALGAFAVLTTLSFAASWFMPLPSDRHKLLDQIEGETRMNEERYSRTRRRPAPAPITESPVDTGPFENEEQDEPAKGSSIDVRLTDELDDDEDFEFGDVDDEADDDEQEPVFATPSAGAAGPAGEQGR